MPIVSRLARPLTGAFVLVVAVAACGGGAPAPADTGQPATAVPPGESAAGNQPVPEAPTPGTSLDACEIVAAGDVATATGVATVEPGTLREKATTLSPGRTECTYEGDFGRLIVELTPEDGANLFDAARGSYDDAVDLPGIGDGAFTSAANKRAFVLEGPVAVMLTMFLSGADQAAVATSLGQAIVARL